MTYPTIHLNGTGIETLIKQYSLAHSTLDTAIRRLDGATPNARDYYPQGHSASYEAMQEHAHRRDRLLSVYAELGQILERLHEEAMNRAIFIEG